MSTECDGVVWPDTDEESEWQRRDRAHSLPETLQAQLTTNWNRLPWAPTPAKSSSEGCDPAGSKAEAKHLRARASKPGRRPREMLPEINDLQPRGLNLKSMICNREAETA